MQDVKRASPTGRTKLRDLIGLPVLRVTSKRAPSTKARKRGEIAYGIETLEDAALAF